MGDQRRLCQVVLPLLSNALKFTLKGEIEVQTRVLFVDRHNAKVVISIRDTGIAIDKQRAIFNLFEQVDGSVTRQFGGTGLGLALSQRLIVNMILFLLIVRCQCLMGLMRQLKFGHIASMEKGCLSSGYLQALQKQSVRCVKQSV